MTALSQGLRAGAPFSPETGPGGNRERTMRLPATEFLRRFLLHVLPKGFAKIRHYGILAHRSGKLARCRELLDTAPPGTPEDSGAGTEETSPPGDSASRCPKCGSTALVRHELPPGVQPARHLAAVSLDSS